MMSVIVVGPSDSKKGKWRRRVEGKPDIKVPNSDLISHNRTGIENNVVVGAPG